MAKYLVCIRIYYYSNSFMNQYYIVDKTQLSLIKKLNIDVEGSCCGTTRCFACLMEGINLKYHMHTKINDGNMDIAKMVCQDQIYEMDYLLGKIEDINDSDEDENLSIYVKLRCLYDEPNNNTDITENDIIEYFSQLPNKELITECQNNDDMYQLFAAITQHYQCNLLRQVFDAFQNKLDKSLFNKMVQNNGQKYRHILEDIYLAYGLKKTCQFIEKYYNRAIMFLEQFNILEKTDKNERIFLKKYLKKYPNMILSTNEKNEIWLEKKHVLDF